MNLLIGHGKLNGRIRSVPSKSQSHRALICAAFADRSTLIEGIGDSEDIRATRRALECLGAQTKETPKGLLVEPVSGNTCDREFDCGESGSTLRFILPLIGAKGADISIKMHGRLSKRPLTELLDCLTAAGMSFKQEGDILKVSGRLRSTEFELPGNVSSQYISSILMAMPLLEDGCSLKVIGDLSSAAYVDITRDVMKIFSVDSDFKDGIFTLKKGCRYRSPGEIRVEGDWSNAAFWIAAQNLGSDLKIEGLTKDSCQGDKASAELIPLILKGEGVINVDPVPDLLPIMAITACAAKGETLFTGAARLRAKESDRIASTQALIEGLGGICESGPDFLKVKGCGKLHGGRVDSFSDHRIAMSAAIASTISDGEIHLKNAQCVAKSYPAFWDDFKRLGGIIKEEGELHA